MNANIHEDNIESVERRKFFETAGKVGFTAAAMVGAAGMLMSPQASAAISNEEQKRKKAAKYTMTIATAYILGASRGYPIMQLDFKENIQNFTNGQVYVKLAPGGQLGQDLWRDRAKTVPPCTMQSGALPRLQESRVALPRPEGWGANCKTAKKTRGGASGGALAFEEGVDLAEDPPAQTAHRHLQRHRLQCWARL